MHWLRWQRRSIKKTSANVMGTLLLGWGGTQTLVCALVAGYFLFPGRRLCFLHWSQALFGSLVVVFFWFGGRRVQGRRQDMRSPRKQNLVHIQQSCSFVVTHWVPQKIKFVSNPTTLSICRNTWGRVGKFDFIHIFVHVHCLFASIVYTGICPVSENQYCSGF